MIHKKSTSKEEKGVFFKKESRFSIIFQFMCKNPYLHFKIFPGIQKVSLTKNKKVEISWIYPEKMRIFLSIQYSLKVLGIYRPRAFEQFHRINLRNASFFIFFLLFSIATILYMVYEVDTFRGYSEALLGVAVGLSIIGGSIVFITKTNNIFQLIDDFEKAIDQRE